jgi:hypothetical protein
MLVEDMHLVVVAIYNTAIEKFTFAVDSNAFTDVGDLTSNSRFISEFGTIIH